MATSPSAMNPNVPIQLDRMRTLRLDLNAMIRFEEATGIDLVNGETIDLHSMKNLRALLWACLVHEDPDITIEQVGSLIDLSNMQYVADQVSKVWSAAIPEPKDQPKNAKRASR